ncbi:hypothetical protein [Streptomyces sp. 8L]|uniref:hypothetical protein n=1 Tax=Streptomyces sp. 8L TaxID=2877242 RepID=UPI001CD453C3|nr:hypothetical protein [Streptomyces sp. 8L]MCA1218770.1 hypothetical protein [Streptomyces sp. 8L]
MAPLGDAHTETRRASAGSLGLTMYAAALQPAQGRGDVRTGHLEAPSELPGRGRLRAAHRRGQGL